MGGKRRPQRFYWDQFTDNERKLLAEAGHATDAAPGTLDEEIELLRVLIHRLMAQNTGDADGSGPERVSRLVERLGRLHRARRAVTAEAGGPDPYAALAARVGDRVLRENRARAMEEANR